MPPLPNPFSAASHAVAEEAAVSSPIALPNDAAATDFPRGFDSGVLEEILGLRPILPISEF